MTRRWRSAGAVCAFGLSRLQRPRLRHAWALTHFTTIGKRTPRPEQLSLPHKLLVLATGATLPRPHNDRTPADLGLSFERPLFKTSDGLALEGWGGWQQGFNGFRHNPVDYARRVRVPTLLMQGDRDDRVSVAEAQPAAWKAAVAAFLSSLREEARAASG